MGGFQEIIMSKPAIKVGLLGLGTIGKGVARVLIENADNLARRAGRSVELAKAVDLDIDRDFGVNFPEDCLTTDANAVLDDPEIAVIVEVIGGVNPAKAFIEKALGNGKHVVTSNKEVIAKHGASFLKLARENGVNLYYEAAVGGGIPIIHGLKNCLSANNIQEIVGIMNGTTNFILTKMAQEGAEFEAVLKEAQAAGYAEADPTADVDGYDVAYKLAILGSIAFNTHFSYEDIYFEGIRNIAREDIKIAGEMGYVIKLVAIGVEREDGRVELRVHPTMIPVDHPLAGVNHTFNAVFVKGNYIDECMFYGHGAGMLPTASAVVADIMDIAMAADLEGSHPSITTDFRKREVVPIGEVESEYYLRLQVKDQLGVLGSIAKICAENQVSIKTVQQHVRNGEAAIELITHRVRESAMQEAIARIRELDTILGVASLLRVGL